MKALVLLARRTSDTTISRSTTTDAKGRFTFEGLPAGEYVVALESAWLDSLELSLPPTTVELPPGERRQVELALPSGATLRTSACPGVILPTGTGAVSGRVWDAADERPLGGARVTIGWSETTVDPATLRATSVPEGAEVTTDSLGRFRVCGVPTETYLDLRASLGRYRELLLQTVVPEDAGVVRQNLSLHEDFLLQRGEGTSGRVAAADSMRLPDRVLRPGPAVALLRGVVYGASAPLPNVQVQMRGESASVLTDQLGGYQLNAVHIGTQVLEVRRVGYLPRRLTLEVHPGANVAPDLHLAPVTTLDSVRVVAERPRYREFESRAKAASFGHFLRAEDIAHKAPLLTSDLVRQMPGFRVVRPDTRDGEVQVIASRGDLTSFAHPGPCFANIVIDGVPHQEINWIDPGSIGAMEIYPGPAGAPVQYQSACGTIIIWTKRY